MRQIFFYHPKFDAQVIDTTGMYRVDTCIPDGSNRPFRCPKCGEGHGTTGTWGSLADKPEKICPSCESKTVDNSPSLVQNNNMCMKNLRFVTAVALAVADIRSGPFSVFNITSHLRKQVNDGELTFTDKTVEDVDGKTTYRVDHNEIRDVFHELRRNGIISGLNARDTGVYIEYSNDVVSVPVPVTAQAPTSCTCAPALPTPLPVDGTIRQKLQDYLKGRMGQNVTMKEIQSRFKGVNKTCKEWADLVANIGFTVNSYGPVSTWTTMV